MNFDASFNPFNELFVAQDQRPGHIRDLDLETLNAFQRVVLIHDGTVTKLFEVYRAEPIEVELLSQKIEVLSDDPWLKLTEPTEVVVREVLLKGKRSGRPVTYAASSIVLDRTPKSIQRGLNTDGMGLGRMMSASLMEHRRELLWYGREHVEEVPAQVSEVMEKDLMSRMYRVVVDDLPLMVINERFSLSLA